MMKTALTTLYGYHAWANSDLLEKLQQVDATAHADELETALRLMSHYHVVARIFSAHLSRTDHGFKADNIDEIPALATLTESLAAVDRWYLDYLGGATESALSQAVPFTFTDGDKGMMTRAEMLMHVALHAGYHRGEIGRILWKLGTTPPWDTYAVYLHQAQPERREQSAI